MNELLLLSKEYISKDNFLNEIHIDNYHFELGGNDNQLWLINDVTDKCEFRIDLILKNENGNIIEDEIDYELYEETDAPYRGFLYSIEYCNTRIKNLILKQIKTSERDLYVSYEASNKFKIVK